MGGSGVVSQLIIFIAVISTATGAVMILKGYVDDTTYTLLSRQRDVEDKIKTDILIELVHVDNTTNPYTTTIYLKNIGSTIIDPDKLQIFMDGIRIPNQTQNRSLAIPTDVDLVNTDLLDPKELIEIKIFKNLEQTQSHETLVSTHNGILAEKEFNI